MVVQTLIQNGRGNDSLAKVTCRGELVVGTLDFSSIYTNTISIVDTAYNYITPLSGQRFVITAILIYADKNVGVNDASIDVYEADSATSTTVLSKIIDIEMVKQTSRDILPLNILVSRGVWVNAKSNDANVYLSISGYYIED